MQQPPRQLLQRLFDPRALGDVLHGSDDPARPPRLVHVYQGVFLNHTLVTVGRDDAVLQFIRLPLGDGRADLRVDPLAVVRVRVPEEQLARHFDRAGLVAVDAVDLIRPDQRVLVDLGRARQIDLPRAQTRHPPRLRQHGLAPAQRLLGPLALGHVAEDQPHESAARLADAEGVNVEPTIHHAAVLDDALGLARGGDPAEPLKPELFRVGQHLAQPLANCVPPAELPLERRVRHLIHPANDAPLAVVDQIDDAEALVNRGEEGAVLLLRHAQRLLSPLALTYIANDAQGILVAAHDARVIPTLLPILSQRVLNDLRFAGLEREPEAMNELFGQLRRQHFPHVLPDKVLRPGV